jgi:hypothetical protein
MRFNAQYDRRSTAEDKPSKSDELLTRQPFTEFHCLLQINNHPFDLTPKHIT